MDKENEGSPREDDREASWASEGLIPSASIVRLATHSDEPDVMNICRALHQENGVFKLSEDKLRAFLKRAFDNQNGLVGLIGGPGRVEAIMFLVISTLWYSDQFVMEELFSFVRPEYRKSSHAKALIEWAKKCSDAVKLPTIIGVLSNTRTEAKVRLYQRQLGKPVGAFFIHVPEGATVEWALDADEDRGHGKRQGIVN